ncbi:ATP-dependent RNA helicase ddx58 [Branchiostoma belcheri]|nr:ATP-dependent RNA helicase ddx58 [Branchiostoma belcheri]
MDASHKNLLRKHRAELVNNIKDVDSVLDHLVSAGVIEDEEEKEIKDREDVKAQVRKLLTILADKEGNSFHSFCTALENSRHKRLGELLKGNGTKKGERVFIIHAGEDKAQFVEPLVQALQDEGLFQQDIFYDVLSIEIGDSIRARIMAAMASESLELVVTVLSQNSLNHKYWPKLELETALKHNKQLFPVWLDDNEDDFQEFNGLVGKYCPTLKSLRGYKVPLGNAREEAKKVAMEIVSKLMKTKGPGSDVPQNLTNQRKRKLEGPSGQTLKHSRPDDFSTEEESPLKAAEDSGDDTAVLSPTATTTNRLKASDGGQPLTTAVQQVSMDEVAEKQEKEGCEKIKPPQAMKPSPEPRQLKDIPLRGYQMELAIPALEGRNTIICAPTGSGKTRVAIKITREHLEGATVKGGAGVDVQRRVVFLVNKVPLVKQQYSAFLEYLSPKYNILPLSGETAADIPVGETLIEHDVIILTAQVLENALRDGLITLDTFSMLIFDECHHCQKNDPYNAIMTRYIKQKWEEKSGTRLPQIIGLTASLGAGKAKSLEDTVEHILKACANLDAEWISQVVEHKDELLEYNQNQTKHLTPEDLKPPRQRESQAYEQWVVTLARDGATLKDDPTSRVIHAATNHLRKYKDALAINADARTKDALQYLDRFVTGLPKEGFDSTDEDLVKHFTEARGELQEYAADSKYSNPKLDQLKYMILQAYAEKPDSRCLLFCKTRALTIALLTWMQEDEALRKLNPGRLVGAGARESTEGMTQNQQVELLELFVTGGHKIVISTSVAEEGIDIANCNFVFRYDYVGNEIGKVQTRGRGRAEGSKSVLIAGREGGNIEKEKLNTIRENLMEKAMLHVYDMQREKHDDFMKEVRRLQLKSKMDRDMALMMKPEGKAKIDRFFVLEECGYVFLIRSGGRPREYVYVTRKVYVRGLHDTPGRQRLRASYVAQVVSELYVLTTYDLCAIATLPRTGRTYTCGVRTISLLTRTLKVSGPGMKLLCVKCKGFACNDSDFRKIEENHHVVVDKAFLKRIIITPHQPKKIDDWERNGKVWCKNCRQDWGIQMVYRQASFPTLKIKSFVLEKPDGTRLTCRKWKQAPFEVGDITSDDISGMLETPEEEKSE